MPAAIKLMRLGKKGNPSYRIVVVDKRKKRNTNYKDLIGFYDPTANPVVLKVNKDKLIGWLKKGAVASEGIVKLGLAKKVFKKD